MNVEGRFMEAGTVEYVGKNQTAKRKFKLDIQGNSMYENLAEFTLMGDKVSMVDNINKGSRLDVHFNINGRIWQKTATEQVVIQDLQCWKIDIIQKTAAAVTAAPAPPTAGQAVSDNDLPFDKATEEEEVPF